MDKKKITKEQVEKFVEAFDKFFKDVEKIFKDGEKKIDKS